MNWVWIENISTRTQNEWFFFSLGLHLDICLKYFVELIKTSHDWIIVISKNLPICL